jgi:hypothetical protein
LLCKAWTDRGLVYSARGKIAMRGLDEKPSIFVRDKPIFSSERMLRKDYDRKDSVEKISGRESQGTWGQDELISGKPPVVMLL